MAKIDVSTIEGYAEMSAEDKIKALENFEYETHGDEVIKLKNSLNKASSDVAEFKRQLKEKMTEDERIKAEREEEEKNLREELARLKKDKEIASLTSSYLELGYSNELAKSSAEAMLGGDMNTVFTNQKTFNELQKNSLMANLIGKQPSLSSGEVPKSSTAEDEELAKFRKSLGI